MTNDAKSIEQQSSAKRHIISLQFFLALLGSCMAISVLVWISTSTYGVSLSPDSVGYVGVARNLVANRGLISYEGGAPFVVQPPLYPMILAGIAALTGMDPLLAARLVQTATAAALLLATGIVARTNLRSFPVLVYLTLLATIVAAPLVEIEIAALSEALFSVWLLLAVLCLDRYLAGATLRWLIGAALMVALASITRYIGVALILGGILVILSQPVRQFSIRLSFAAIFAAIAGTPLVLWLMRNYSIGGTVAGTRVPSAFTLTDNLGFLADTVGLWILPREAPSVMIVVFATAFSLVLGWLGARHLSKYHVSTLTPSSLLLITSSYLLFLVIASTIMAYDRVGSRLLAPIYIPLLLLLMRSVAWGMTKMQTDPYGQFAVTGIMTGICIWLSIAAVALWDSTQSRIANGAGGYNRTSWQQDDVIDYLRNLREPLVCPIYSNAPDALYILANISAEMSPAHKINNSTQVTAELADLRNVWPPEKSTCIVWLNRQERSYLFPLESLLSTVQIDREVILEDGSLHIVRRR